MKCHDAVNLMHIYLDGDIDEYTHQELFNHLKHCEACKTHFDELKQTDRILLKIPQMKAPYDMIQNIMLSLPKKKREPAILKRLKKHPFLAAASIFILLFGISMISYVPSSELKITAGDYNRLIVQGNEVIVPEGLAIDGDIIVENGNLQIRGEVKGDVTVINGNILMADASSVDGNTNQIDRIFEWLLYNIKKFWVEVSQ